MVPRGRVDPHHASVRNANAGNLAVLHDVDPAPIGGARIAPDDRIVPRRAAPALQQAALDRKARIIEVQIRHQAAHLLAIEQLRVDAMEPHRVSPARERIALWVGMVEVEHAALAHHGVVVEILLQSLPQLHRPFVEWDVAGQQVVGSYDGGVASGIAGSDPTLLQHRHIGDAVLLRQVVSGGKPVPAAPYDHDIIGLARRRIAPRRLPARLPGDGVPCESEGRIPHALIPTNRDSSYQQSSVV